VAERRRRAVRTNQRRLGAGAGATHAHTAQPDTWSRPKKVPRARPAPADDGHYRDIKSGRIIDVGADDDGGSFLRSGLIGERERHQDDITELNAHH
jgi:hypothetical protein